MTQQGRMLWQTEATSSRLSSRHRGHRAQMAELLRHPPHQMAGDQGAVVDPGTDGVGGDGPVAQPGHQHRAPVPVHLLQQRSQLGGHRLHCPGKGPVRPCLHPLQGQGDIGPPGLAQGPLSRLVQHSHHRDGHTRPLPLLRLHPGQLGGLPRPLLPQLPGLHGQVGPSQIQSAPLPSHFRGFCRIFPRNPHLISV